MEYGHQVLRTIFEIVKDDPSPLTYQCRPRELILRLHEDWNVIYEQLLLLEKDGFLQVKQLDSLVILITQEGINLIRDTAEVS